MNRVAALCFLWVLVEPVCAAQNASIDAQATELRALIQQAARLPLEGVELKAQPHHDGWALGMVSWIAAGRSGLIYLLQRGDKADPIVVLNREGRVVRSWGKGMDKMPHAIRIDPQGNVWTTDAATSMVYKFTPEGKKLMEIPVGGQPTPCRSIIQIEQKSDAASGFCGTTDIAFAPNGHLLITDGYANARIVEYTGDGKKEREWGAAGTRPGQFRLPHSIVIDEKGVIYVSDRENGRIERFDLNGKYLGEWTWFGKTFSLSIRGGAIWLATQPRNLPGLSPGWLLKVDPETGKLLGYVEVTGAHGMEALDNGELMVGPGANSADPQWFRLPHS